MLNREDALKLLEITKKIDEELKTNPDNLSYNLSSKWNDSKSTYIDAVERFYDYKNDKEVAVELALAKSDDFYKVSLADISDDLKNDKETLIRLLNNGCKSVEYHYPSYTCLIPEKFYSDKEVMIAAVRNNESNFQFADEKLYEDRDFALENAKIPKTSYDLIPLEFRADKDFVLEAVKSNADFFALASKELRADKEVAIEAVKTGSWAIQFASKELKNDVEVALAGLNSKRISPDNYFKHAISRTLRKNPEFMSKAIEINPSYYQYAFKDVEFNRDVLMAYYNRGGRLSNVPELRNTLEENKNDKEFWKAISKGDYGLLQYASDEVKSDKEVAKVAVKECGYALEYFKDNIKDDKDIVMMAVNYGGYPLRFASDRLKDDEEIVRAATNKAATSLAYASQRFQDDKELALKAIDREYSFIGDGLSKNLLNDKSFVEGCIYNTHEGHDIGEVRASMIYKNASEEIRSDKDLALKVLRDDGQMIFSVPENLRNDKEVIETALEGKRSYNNAYDIFKSAGDTLKDDKKFVIEMINKFNDGAIIAAVSDRLKDDVEVVKAAKEHEHRYYPVMEHCSQRIQNNPELLDQKPKMSLQDRFNQAKAIREAKEPAVNNPSKNKNDLQK